MATPFVSSQIVVVSSSCREMHTCTGIQADVSSENAVAIQESWRLRSSQTCRALLRCLQSKKQFAQALRVFSRSELYPILIHCQHGLDRTGMVVLLLMMLCHLPVKVPLAISFVSTYRPSHSACRKLLVNHGKCQNAYHSASPHKTFRFLGQPSVIDVRNWRL